MAIADPTTDDTRTAEALIRAALTTVGHRTDDDRTPAECAAELECRRAGLADVIATKRTHFFELWNWDGVKKNAPDARFIFNRAEYLHHHVGTSAMSAARRLPRATFAACLRYLYEARDASADAIRPTWDDPTGDGAAMEREHYMEQAVTFGLAAIHYLREYLDAATCPEERAARAVAAYLRTQYGPNLGNPVHVWAPGEDNGWGDGQRWQVAWEGGFDWAITLSPSLSDHACPDGIHVEPYRGWLMTVYNDG